MNNEKLLTCPECNQTHFGVSGSVYCMDHSPEDHPSEYIEKAIPPGDFKFVSITEIEILKLVINPVLNWDEKFGLLNSYKSVIHPVIFRIGVAVIFDDLVSELRRMWHFDMDDFFLDI